MKKLETRILSFACVLTMLLAMIVLPSPKAWAATEGLDLSTMQIVLPAEPTDVENVSARELKTYVEKITGVTLVINAEGSASGAGIYIGATEQAKQKGVSYPTEGDKNGEAWAIKALDGDLFLCGAPTRGVLYAVYHLLEDVLGVRWWTLWEEYVPTGDAIVPEDYADSGVPAMEYREVFVGKETNTDYAFYARNRMNGDSLHIPGAYGGNEEYGFLHVHTIDKYITANDFAAHPEWFPLIDGTRIVSGNLCMTNSSLKTEFAKRLVNEVAKDPDAIYSVSSGDMAAFCQCDDCQKEIDTYGLSGYLLRFVNEMAAAVTAAGYTDATIEMLPYLEYIDPPKGGVVPAPNVSVRYADIYTDILHGLDHANNAETMEQLQGWIDIASNDVYYWHYVVNYNNNGVIPSMFHYGDNFATLVEMGVNGWFAEQEQCTNVDFWDMKLWLISKLMEEPVTGEEYTALMDDFIFGYYGEEAGKYIREYLYYMHREAEQTEVNHWMGAHVFNAEWLDLQDILTGNDYFEKALAAAGDDATLLRRVRAARAGLDRMIVENFSRWEAQAQEAGIILPFAKREVGERVYATLGEQIKFRGDYDATYPTYLNRYDRYADDLAELPDELDGVAREHILQYTAKNFSLHCEGYTVVEDADSLLGVAARLDAATRVAAGENYLILSEEQKIPVGIWDPDAEEQIKLIGRITKDDIKSNQGYHLYTLEWTVPELVGNGYLYMLGDWGLHIDLATLELLELQGQTVDVCVSMKVEGTVDGSNQDDYPVYYIDRVLIVPKGEDQGHRYVTGNTDYGTVKTACSICGKLVSEEQITQDPDDDTQPDNATTPKDPTIDNGAQIMPGEAGPSKYIPHLIILVVVLFVAAITLFMVVIFKKYKKNDTANKETE